ncbi:hypothetical protein HS125_01665 [bacterium]|nr:hypothetical protein [bacterium]
MAGRFRSTPPVAPMRASTPKGRSVNFRTPDRRSVETLRAEINAHLPVDVTVRSAREVAMNFHARHSPLSRTYRYQLALDYDPFLRRYAWRPDEPPAQSRLAPWRKPFWARMTFVPSPTARSAARVRSRIQSAASCVSNGPSRAPTCCSTTSPPIIFSGSRCGGWWIDGRRGDER